MNTIVLDTSVVRIPDTVTDLTSFRSWTRSDEYPEAGRICFLTGEVWIDMSTEQIFSHNQVKQEFNRVIGGLAKEDGLGRFLPDGVLLTNAVADLSSRPDGVFVSNESFHAGRVRLVEGAKRGYIELEGSPEMVLEVISDSSVEKDTAILPDLYYQASIHEYWVVDARSDDLMFNIYRRTESGYADVSADSGWIASEVFRRAFTLTRRTDSLGHPDFTLSCR